MILQAYTSSEELAKDICFAMARAYGTWDVAVTEVRDYGWHVECCCKDPKCADMVKAILGKKAAKANWL